MNNLAKTVLQHGVADWVPLVDIDAIQRAHETNLDESARKSEAQAVVLELFDTGLVTLGGVTEKGFEPWLSHQRERLAEIYSRADWTYAAWLCNTDEGDRIGEDCSPEGGSPSSGVCAFP